MAELQKLTAEEVEAVEACLLSNEIPDRESIRDAILSIAKEHEDS
jgi:hypothetical protein